MSNVDTDYRDAMKTFCIGNANLPGITSEDQFYWIPQLNRANLQELIAGGVVTPPFVTCGVGKVTPEDWAADTYSVRAPTDLYYCFSAKDPGAYKNGIDSSDGYDATTYAGKIGALMANQIFEYSGPDFQLAGSTPSYDSSDQNPANVIFFQSGRPLYAVQISWGALLTGDIS
jgi:hypothetical protein